MPLAGWSYRRAITVDNTSNSNTHTNYAVKITLSSSQASVFTNSQSSGQDIRFLDTDDSTNLDYWIESWSQGGQTATIWVEIPSLAASSSETIYMYYGNALASAATNGVNTFEHFNDFSTANESVNYAAAATDGVYYDFGGNYPGPHVTGYSYINPQAWRHVGTHDRTWMVYGRYDGAALDWYATYYDHTSDAFGTPVKIQDTPSGTTTDAHAAPALCMDASGYLHVFGGTEGGSSNFAYRKSTNPEDISSWVAQHNIDTNCEYSQPGIVGTDIYVFVRKTTATATVKSFGYFKSTNGGSTWSAYNEVIKFGDPSNIYAVVHFSSAGTIHIAWVPFTTNYQDIFYCKSPDGGTTWEKADGTDITLPVDSSDADLVYDTGSNNCEPCSIWADGDDRAHISSVIGDGVPTDFITGPFTHYHHRWNGSAWVATAIATGGNHHFDRNCLRVSGSGGTSTVKVYTTIGPPTEAGGQLQEYTSTDAGATWAKSLDIVRGTNIQHNYPKNVYGTPSDDLRVIWGSATDAAAGGGSHTLTGSASLNCWGPNNVITSTVALNRGLDGENFYRQTVNRTNGRADQTGGVMEMAVSARVAVRWLNQSLNPTAYKLQARWKPTSMAATPRAIPLMWLWSTWDLQTATHWALSIVWLSTGLRLWKNPSDGGTTVDSQLVATTPTVNKQYLAEMWMTSGTTVNVKVTNETDVTTVFDNTNTAAHNYGSDSLYPAFGLYDNAGSHVGQWDDWIVRKFSSPEPSQTVGAEVSYAGKPTHYYQQMMAA